MALKQETVKVNVVTEVVQGRIPFKNTTVGKTVRTFLQAATGILATALPTLALSEDFRMLIANSAYAPVVLGILPLVIAAVTFLQNYLEPTVPNTTKVLEPLDK